MSASTTKSFPWFPAMRIVSRASVALFLGRNPKLLASKSASKMGSITIFAAVCTTRSRTLSTNIGLFSVSGMPSRLPLRPLDQSRVPSLQRVVLRAFPGVGSEVARLRASHRPPLKLYVQFSRIQLSRRLALPRCNRRDQLNQVHQPVLAIQLGFRQLSPATVPPPLESMRPNAPHYPAVEPVEELSDVGSLVVMAPSPQHRIQFLNQLFGLERNASPGKRAHLIHETPDRFLPRDRVQRPRLSTTADLPRRQLKLLTAFDLVPKKLESLPHVHNPRLLRMQLHAQFVQNPKRRGHCRSRLCCRLAGCYPVVGVPRELISFAPHLLIERRQKDVAEQG